MEAAANRVNFKTHRDRWYSKREHQNRQIVSIHLSKILRLKTQCDRQANDCVKSQKNTIGCLVEYKHINTYVRIHIHIHTETLIHTHECRDSLTNIKIRVCHSFKNIQAPIPCVMLSSRKKIFLPLLLFSLYKKSGRNFRRRKNVCLILNFIVKIVVWKAVEMNTLEMLNEEKNQIYRNGNRKKLFWEKNVVQFNLRLFNWAITTEKL